MTKYDIHKNAVALHSNYIYIYSWAFAEEVHFVFCLHQMLSCFFFTRPAVEERLGGASCHLIAVVVAGYHFAMSSHHLSSCLHFNNILSKTKQTVAFELARNWSLYG